MHDTAAVLVIVPAYNEAPETLRSVLKYLRAADYSVLLVDDGSELPCADLAGQFGCSYLAHPRNLGQGAALRTGMNDAVHAAQVEYVVHFDADGQHQVADLPDLLAPLRTGEVDVVLGSRFLLPNPETPLLKRYLLKAGRLFHGLLLGMWLSDAHCGLRALNRRAFTAIQLEENRMAHASEILMEIRRHQLRWMEVPVRITYSEYAVKKGQSAWKALPIAWRVLCMYIGRK